MDAFICCETCGLAQRVDELQPGMAAECSRCGSVIATRKLLGPKLETN